MRPLPCSLSLIGSLLLGCAPAPPPPSAPATATAEIPAPVAPPPTEPDPGAAPAPEEAATPPEAPAAPLDDEAARARILAGIRRVKDERYEVTREALDLMLDDLDRVTGRGEFKVTPAERAGQVVGLRIFGVSPGQPMAALGFLNGDVVRQVAGKPMTSPDQALEAYASIRKATSVNVEIERKGKTQTVTYQLVEK